MPPGQRDLGGRSHSQGSAREREKTSVGIHHALAATHARRTTREAFLFDVDETDDVPDYSGTVTQALSLLNGQLLGQGARAIPGSALDDVLARPGDDASKVDALVLRVLSRRPTDAERTKWVNYVQIAEKTPPPTIPPPKRGGPDLGAPELE